MKVKVYSTKNCPACILAKKYLDDNKFKYESIIINVDISSEDFVKLTNVMSVPVIYVDDKQIIGFDKLKLQELLNL